MIRIVNLRHKPVMRKNEVLIKIDRSSVLGNPFFMKSEDQRDIVCNQYEQYFGAIVQNWIGGCIIEKKNEEFVNELWRIGQLSKTQDIALACWCAPKRCHGETIKDFIDMQLKGDK